MKRTLLLGSAWTASAAAAVGLGFLAISLVDASASDGPVTPAAATSDAPGATSTSGPAAVAAGQQVTDGGTVYGSCDDGGAPLVASAPAAGWWLDDSSDAGEVEFQNGTTRVEVRITCVDGVPRFAVEGPRTDDRGGDDGPSSVPSSGTSSSTSTPAAPTSSAGDDSDGRVGGGHGSDDGPGDDSSGRDGRGHGSDD